MSRLGKSKKKSSSKTWTFEDKIRSMDFRDSTMPRFWRTEICSYDNRDETEQRPNSRAVEYLSRLEGEEFEVGWQAKASTDMPFHFSLGAQVSAK